MGGIDKAAIEVGGVRLLDRVLAAARPVCDTLVVVGPRRATAVAGVRFGVEAAPGGGPVPGVAAGLDLLGPCDVVVVLAADLPMLRQVHVERLIAAVGGDPAPASAAAATDRFGANPLLAAYHYRGLHRRLGDLRAGAAAARLLPPTPITVDLGAASVNVNEPGDLALAELLVPLDPIVADTVQWIRNVVITAVPDAEEAVDPASGVEYRRRGADPFCSVKPGSAGVTVSLREASASLEVQTPGRPPAAELATLVKTAAKLR
jgi:molybdopterin-guanine dinucleotide biosynthesis protein A